MVSGKYQIENFSDIQDQQETTQKKQTKMQKNGSQGQNQEVKQKDTENGQLGLRAQESSINNIASEVLQTGGWASSSHSSSGNSKNISFQAQSQFYNQHNAMAGNFKNIDKQFNEQFAKTNDKQIRSNFQDSNNIVQKQVFVANDQKQLQSIASFGHIQLNNQIFHKEINSEAQSQIIQQRIISNQEVKSIDSSKKKENLAIQIEQFNEQKSPSENSGLNSQGKYTPQIGQSMQKKNPRVNSQGFDEAAMAAIAAANGLIIPSQMNKINSNKNESGSLNTSARYLQKVKQQDTDEAVLPTQDIQNIQNDQIIINMQSLNLNNTQDKKQIQNNQSPKNNQINKLILSQQQKVIKGQNNNISQQNLSIPPPAVFSKEQIKFFQNGSQGSQQNQNLSQTNQASSQRAPALNQFNPTINSSTTDKIQTFNFSQGEKIDDINLKSTDQKNNQKKQEQNSLDDFQKSLLSLNNIIIQKKSISMNQVENLSKIIKNTQINDQQEIQQIERIPIESIKDFQKSYDQSKQSNQIKNISMRSQSSYNSGRIQEQIVKNLGVQGILLGNTGVNNIIKSSNVNFQSPDTEKNILQAQNIQSDQIQDPYAYYVINGLNSTNLQNKLKNSGSHSSSFNNQQAQLNMKGQNRLGIKKLGTQLVMNSDFGGDSVGSNDHNNQQCDINQTHLNQINIGVVNSCRPNLYNKHNLIISQRSGANKNQQIGINQQQKIDDNSQSCENSNGLIFQNKESQNQQRQQSFDKQMLLIKQMQASERQIILQNSNMDNVMYKNRYQMSIDSHEKNQKKINDLNKKCIVASPGDLSVVEKLRNAQIQLNKLDSGTLRKQKFMIEEGRQILSGESGNLGPILLTGANLPSGKSNMFDHYQNQSLTSNNDRLHAKGVINSNNQFVKFIGSAGSGSHGSNFNSSVSTFPAAPIQKLSDVKNPQKLLTFRFINRKITKIQEISLFKNLRELDLSGNLLQEEIKELNNLNFLKNLNLSYNKIQNLWCMPKRIEILNLSHNQIKMMPEDVSKKLQNVTTLDISNNKLESLENFQYLHRLKRLIAKNNYVRQLAPIKFIDSIYEIDLEGNAIDSHIDFLEFIKAKNDLIVANLFQNPIMVDVDTIEKFNEELQAKAPDLYTKKTNEEIEEFKELMGLNFSDGGKKNIEIQSKEACSKKNDVDDIQFQKQQQNKTQQNNGIMGDDSCRFNLHLIKELADCLTFLKNGVFYRNKRVYNKIRQIQLITKRSISNYSNSSNSAVIAQQNGQNIAHSSGRIAGMNKNSKSGMRLNNNQINIQNNNKEESSQGNINSVKTSPIDNHEIQKSNFQNNSSSFQKQQVHHVNSGFVSNNNLQTSNTYNGLSGKNKQKYNNLSSSVGHSPILSKKSHRFEDIENFYDQIVEQEELKRLKQQKILAQRRKLRKKQRNNTQENGKQSQCGSQSSDNSHSSYEFSEGSDMEDEEDYLDEFENSYDAQSLSNFIERQNPKDIDNLMIDQSQCMAIAGHHSSRMLDNSYFNQQYHNHLHDDDVVSQTITSDLEADLNMYKRIDVDNLYENYEQNQHNNSNLEDNDYLNGSTAGFGKKLREINREINNEQLDSIEKSQQSDFLKDSNQKNNYQSVVQKKEDALKNENKNQISQSAQKEKLKDLYINQKLLLNEQLDTKIKNQIIDAQLQSQQQILKKNYQKLNLDLKKINQTQQPKNQLNESLQNQQQISKTSEKKEDYKSILMIQQESNQSKEIQQSKIFKKDLKIDLKIIEEYNKKKYVQTEQNSKKSSNESLTKNKDNINGVQVEINELNEKLKFNKKKSGGATINNSISEKQLNQHLNQSFSLRNIQINGDNNQQHEVESLMMNRQIIEGGPQNHQHYNEFSAKNQIQAQNFILQSPLDPNPTIIKDSQENELKQKENKNENAQYQKKETQKNEKKNIQSNFKLDLSKCFNNSKYEKQIIKKQMQEKQISSYNTNEDQKEEKEECFCDCCISWNKKYIHQINIFQSSSNIQLDNAQTIINQYKKVLDEIKSFLLLKGDLETFDIISQDNTNKSNDLDKDNKKLSKIIKLNKFTQIFHSFFKRIYRDIQNLKNQNEELKQKLQVQDGQQDQQKNESIDEQRRKLKDILMQLNKQKPIVQLKQNIKIPNIDQIAQQLADKKSTSQIKIPQAPKTVSCRQNQKRKSLEKHNINIHEMKDQQASRNDERVPLSSSILRKQYIQQKSFTSNNNSNTNQTNSDRRNMQLFQSEEQMHSCDGLHNNFIKSESEFHTANSAIQDASHSDDKQNFIHFQKNLLKSAGGTCQVGILSFDDKNEDQQVKLKKSYKNVLTNRKTTEMVNYLEDNSMKILNSKIQLIPMIEQTNAILIDSNGNNIQDFYSQNQMTGKAQRKYEQNTFSTNNSNQNYRSGQGVRKVQTNRNTTCGGFLKDNYKK